MISAGDVRNGMCFEMDDQVYQVVEFQHVKPGKGAAFVRTKYKNVKTGSVVERSFNPNEKFEQAQLTRQDMQFIYADGDLYYFMDQDTYEQTPIHQDKIGDGIKFLKEALFAVSPFTPGSHSVISRITVIGSSTWKISPL